jgi:putative peptidoglycan lipid II flippase
MSAGKGWHRHVGTVSYWTLASRILGLVRDMLTARAFGVTSVMADFATAWTIPNLFRRLFGEGALTASFIPVFSEHLEMKGRGEAMRLWGAVTALLMLVLGGLLLLGEAAVLGALALLGPKASSATLLLLTAVMLPYSFLICLVALKGAVLQTLRHFTVPALTPVVLNLCWIAALVWIVPRMAGGVERQVFVVALTVVVAGALQLLLQFPALRRAGASLRLVFDLHHDGVKRIIRLMLPMMLGLAVFQLNVLIDRGIAWGFALRPNGPPSLDVFGRLVPMPMKEGAAAVLFYADRLFEFPIGVFGLAVATVVYPALSAHAARGALAEMLGDLRKALRTVLFIGLPASAGMMILRWRIVDLFYNYREFAAQPESLSRTALVLLFYSAAIWTYCADQVLVRGFYALKDSRTPVRVSVATVGLNLVLNLTFIWFLAEAGLALSTALCALVHLGALALILRRRVGRLGGREIARSVGRSLIATAAMSAAVLLVMAWVPMRAAARPDAPPAAVQPAPATASSQVVAPAPADRLPARPFRPRQLGPRIVALGLPLGAGLLVYFLAAAVLRCREMRELLGRYA